ncbi:MAG TPA: lysylphosphatidylglycerol synthase transmembrane domain-containing protein [Steroidobacteraceae bacterium]
MTLTRWQKGALRLIGTIALIAGIFWFIPFREVLTALRNVHLGWIAVAFALNLVVAALEALQLWLLLNRAGISVAPWPVFETKFIARFYGQFLPSDLLASAVKLQILAGPTRQYGEVTAALVFCRVVNTLGLLLLGLVLWTIEWPTGPGRWIGIVMFGMLASLFLAHLALASRAVNRHAGRILATPVFAWLKGKVMDKVGRFMRTMAESYRLFDNMVWNITFVSLVRHVVGILSFACAALALDIHLSLVTIGWIRVVIQALMMLPIHLSGIGVREGSLVILLQEYSVPAGDAVALAFMLFVIYLVGNSMGGLFELKNLLRARRNVVAGSRPE